MLSLLILAVHLCKSSTHALQIVDNKRVQYHLIRATTLQNPDFRRRYHPMTSIAGGRSSSSSSPLFNDISSSNNNSNSGDDVESSSLVAYNNIATWARPLILFSLGYGVGTISAPGWQRQSKVMSNIGFTRLALIFFISRDIWRSTPNWLKPKITRYGKKVANILRMPFRKKSMIDESEADDDDDDTIVDDTDISDLSNFATKLQRVMNVAEQKLEIKEDFNVQASVLAYLQLLSQVEASRASSHDKIYRESGVAVPDDMLEGLDVFFELADLAYDEHKDGNIQQVLEHMGYHLVKHDISDVPGYLGHYIAINSDSSSKTAIIGVKGTSNFGDLVTDMCASSEQYSLPNPFYEGGSTSLTCHEGVWISSSRLFDTLLPIVRDLLLPSDYSLVLVGHSLGAGCATILSMLLRASIPSLQDSNKLKVYAFASPPILNLDSALGCSSYVTTIVNNVDVIPRANISPVVVTTKVLRAINTRLKERKLDMSDFKSTIAFLNKMKQGKDGELLMSADEIISTLEGAIETELLDDPDHLYIPGKVIVMYNLAKEEDDDQNKVKDLSTVVSDWMKQVKDVDMHLTSDEGLKEVCTEQECILSDGTCKPLRYIEPDQGISLIDNHMAPAYRSSIANILSSRRIIDNTVTVESDGSGDNN